MKRTLILSILGISLFSVPLKMQASCDKEDYKLIQDEISGKTQCYVDTKSDRKKPCSDNYNDYLKSGEARIYRLADCKNKKMYVNKKIFLDEIAGAVNFIEEGALCYCKTDSIDFYDFAKRTEKIKTSKKNSKK